MRTIAVVGASLAGLSSARALRAAGYDGRLVLVGAESHRPYDRPPLSKEFLAGTMGLADLALEDENDDLDAHWRLGVAAQALDPAGRSIVLEDGSRVTADAVIVATGATARTLPGADDLGGVHTLRTVDDAVRLKADLQPGARLVVIGAGFIGAETASTAYRLGLDVTVIEAQPTPLAGPLGVTMGEVVSRLHAAHGVRLHCGTGVRRFTGTGRVDGVELDDGRLLPADVVVVGVGAQPTVEWLAGSGVDLANGVLCDASGRTAVPEVFAVGDCAAWFDRRLRRHSRVEHWTGALERPRYAAAALLSGGLPDADPAPPYFWSDQYDVRIQFAGDARSADSVDIEEGDVERHSFLAVYRRDGEAVAVLGLNQPRLFTRWRRALSVVVPAAG
jgi:NADPH-dependent 2,4-dienoyl-CoA reductase/sulfur reductase-like enzyme